MTSGLRKGELVTWKDDRGFGFIRPADKTQDVFLHISELKDATRRPIKGDIVYFRAIAEGKKIRASNAFIQGARRKSTSSTKNKRTRTSIDLAKIAFQTSLLVLIPLAGSLYLAWTQLNPSGLVVYIVMSLLTFALYADDKTRAKKGRWRIPERNLHFCELVGGWPGGFMGQQVLRHKSRKQSYQAVFWAVVVIHLVLWIGWFLTILL